MQNLFIRIRALPEEDRWRLIIFGAGIAGILFFVLWLLLLPLQMKSLGALEKSDNTEGEKSPGSFVRSSLGGAVSGFQQHLRIIAAELEQEKNKNEAPLEERKNEAGVAPTQLP
ncbi:MAG: hypothetical protein A2806_01770 [Candidatus Terrybacteria bacterium RIFCSPHIGHO2_01_FULL_48_17]|uniref:Uncharacterized protein n=1 Tax=Candidatus Terrybacteria bacterium RIFCSPHIGHO2_01_FULL_48_17 TaxID=1802362 RepID=A0A1G2PL60_9BACT|nr:MAG: hypothetical protein A2806_01770 [Candidatus Terrybacteria bacterium RIFCSPHIGHO2_01_FULL_48_17]OHA52663.1 MAG: hypothetical protein A3A30_03525 [Candidatus Terrybacteria bacterium RIFCSPLOWO2_01_FULL_48_14]